MSNEIAIKEMEFSAPEIRDRVNLIQTVMQSVMKKDTHYGTIPYTPKPTLYKAGAEVLCMTFKIAQEYKVEDLSTTGEARYRVTCTGRHQITGQILGEGLGECSSMEEKYAYRAAVCKEEFDAAPESQKRVKWSKGKNGNAAYSVNQIKTNVADLANTILKMACKRAMVAMTLNVTAASDIFSQDLEDFPEELREFVKTSHDNKPNTPTFYSETDFSKNFGKWSDVIQSGKKTAQEIIAMIESKAPLTEKQKAEILGVKAPIEGELQ